MEQSKFNKQLLFGGNAANDMDAGYAYTSSSHLDYSKIRKKSQFFFELQMKYDNYLKHLLEQRK
jgi:hypothetical protein